MEIHELAVLMASDNGNSERSKTGNYYMTNINHLAIEKLRRRFCESRGIQFHAIMSDEQRYEFELSILHPAARKMIEDFLAKRGEMGNDGTSDPKAN